MRDTTGLTDLERRQISARLPGMLGIGVFAVAFLRSHSRDGIGPPYGVVEVLFATGDATATAQALPPLPGPIPPLQGTR